MNTEEFKNLVKNVDTQLFELVSNLICSICQELLNNPVTTPCCHSFCNGCIKRVLSSKDNSGCPLCKNPVKRYCLEGDKVKLTLSEICKELPAAFKEDVSKLGEGIKGLDEDLISKSKLAQLCNQESVKDSKPAKRKTARGKTKKQETDVKENESGSFVPVLKRSKRVVEYASAKKKRLDDFVSISQTDLASNSSMSSDFDKKLEKMEKIGPEEKVTEWFNAVGDNIYLNSPNSSFVELAQVKNGSEGEKKENEKPSMIRVDYGKGSRSKVEGVDPYVFIPSQNKGLKRKRQKKAEKKMPDFKALQSFTKESLKRNRLLLNEDEEKVDEEGDKTSPKKDLITASQKFDQLLSETKGKESKNSPVTHVLYSESQASSPKFLDCSFHSKIEVERNAKRGKERKVGSLQDGGESILFLEPGAELFTDTSVKRRPTRSKRRRSVDPLKSVKRKKLFSETTESTKGETRGSEQKETKLIKILKELVDDEAIYANRPKDNVVRLSDIEAGIVTQNTALIGFCTQGECPEEKRFKEVVDAIEKELDSSERSLKKSSPLMEIPTKLTPSKETRAVVSSEKANKMNPHNGLITFNLLGRITKNKTSFVEFLRLGRLTPALKRYKSSVVRLAFPMGLSTFAKKRALQTKFAVGVQTPQSDREKVSQVSAGIQTSQKMTSATVQTSQVVQNSTTIQTTQEERSSVEIQTSQAWTSSAGIQTTQVFVESALVQTSQREEPPPEVDATLRRPISKHLKIIERERSPLPEERKSSPGDLISDIEVEKEFEKTWLKETQPHHEDLVELKNKKNTKTNVKKADKKDKEEEPEFQPPNMEPTPKRTLSHDLTTVEEKHETRQLIPLNVRKVSRDEEMEVIDLDTPKSQTSEVQMLRVLKNIDLDLIKCRKKRELEEKEEKSEESDSDFFVEQTPPRPTIDTRNPSRSRKPTPGKQAEERDNSEGMDLIEDSIPKGFSESFLLSASQKTLHTSEINKIQSQKEFPRDKSNENDQNQLNAEKLELMTKNTQLKAGAEAWKRSETPKSRACIVTSSVRNPDTIKKFVNTFKMEYSNKPTKNMTHLIVGLHENDDGEILPLCTPKLLFAMANKKWVVSEQWAATSLRLNELLPEDSFETPDPVGGGGCRTARLSSEGPLKKCEVYLLGPFGIISKEDFATLIQDCGGTLVSRPEDFSFCPSKLRMIVADRDCLNMNEREIQELHEKHSTVILSRDAIIMTIQSYSLPNFIPYLLHSASKESLLRLGYPPALLRNDDLEGEGSDSGSLAN